MNLTFISILRAISILIVVFFHTYGYMYAQHFPASVTQYNNTYFWVNQCVFINIAIVSPVHAIHGMDERTDSWNVRQGQCSWIHWLWQYFMTDCKYLAHHSARTVFVDWLGRKIG